MGEALTRKYGPLPGWAWGLIIAIAAYAFLYYKKKQAAAAAAAAQQQQGLSSNLGTVPVSNLTTTAQPMPIQLGDTFVNTSTPVTVNNPAPIVPPPPPTGTQPPAPAPPPPPAPVPTPSTKGYGLVNTVQGLMYWLGVNTAGNQIYNVGGGAPVYFGNASGLAQGSQYEQPGQDIYTPVGYGNQIAGTPQPLQQAYT